MSVFRAEDYRSRIEECDGWSIRIISYKLPTGHVAKVDNISPGAIIARAVCATREEAERSAIDQARARLARTRRFPTKQLP